MLFRRQRQVRFHLLFPFAMFIQACSDEMVTTTRAEEEARFILEFVFRERTHIIKVKHKNMFRLVLIYAAVKANDIQFGILDPQSSK